MAAFPCGCATTEWSPPSAWGSARPGIALVSFIALVPWPLALLMFQPVQDEVAQIAIGHTMSVAPAVLAAGGVVRTGKNTAGKIAGAT